MSALVHCIYTSVQSHPLTMAELDQLIAHSRAENVSHSITGILLHVKDTFFQILEGPEDVIEALYAKILLDDRHFKVTRIIFEPIPRRFFGDSSMTLATLSPAELATMLEEDSPERRAGLLTGLDEGRAKRLLRAFTDGRWRQHATPTRSLEAEL